MKKTLKEPEKKTVLKGVVDIGTNSCRLFIAEIEKTEKEYLIKRKLLKILEITTLGEDVNKNGYLLNRAMDRTVDVLKFYSKKMDDYKVSEKIVCATSAVRDSSNRDEFISRAKEEAGLEVRCIAGETEAALSFKGASSDIAGDLLIIDIGGGSTEFINGNDQDINFIKSYNIGAVRLTEMFFSGDNYSYENISSAEKWVKNQLKEVKALKNKNYTLTGVAGTVTTNVTVKEEMEIYEPEKVHLYKLTLKDIEDNLKLYLSKPLEERRKLKGLPPKRADVITAGTFILKWIMELLQRDWILISENDILEGMMESKF